MTTTPIRPADTDGLSAECALAQQDEYKDLHGQCRQTKDVPLPHSSRVLLQRRCRCSCHPWGRPRKVRKP